MCGVIPRPVPLPNPPARRPCRHAAGNAASGSVPSCVGGAGCAGGAIAIGAKGWQFAALPIQAVRRRSNVEAYLAGELNSAAALARLEERCDLSCSRRIGSGSIGDVVLARDRETGQDLAVKVVSLERLQEVGAEEASLRREIQTLLAVKHPNVVQLVEALHTDQGLPGVRNKPPYLCLAMEYIVNSKPLSALIGREEANPKLAYQVLPQIVGALQEFHAKGFVHRDVWSENVLVDDEGNAVLVDLGCSAQFSHGPDVENRMNVPYMSPQASAGERQQPGDDCWALGCLVTEMVTGRFIIDALGSNEAPLHRVPAVLHQRLHSTYCCGDRHLGDIASQLLVANAHHRLQMRELGVILHALKAAEPFLMRSPSHHSLSHRDSARCKSPAASSPSSIPYTPRHIPMTPGSASPPGLVWQSATSSSQPSPMPMRGRVVASPARRCVTPISRPPRPSMQAQLVAAPPPGRLSRVECLTASARKEAWDSPMRGRRVASPDGRSSSQAPSSPKGASATSFGISWPTGPAVVPSPAHPLPEQLQPPLRARKGYSLELRCGTPDIRKASLLASGAMTKPPLVLAWDSSPTASTAAPSDQYQSPMREARASSPDQHQHNPALHITGVPWRSASMKCLPQAAPSPICWPGGASVTVSPASSTSATMHDRWQAPVRGGQCVDIHQAPQCIASRGQQAGRIEHSASAPRLHSGAQTASTPGLRWPMPAPAMSGSSTPLPPDAATSAVASSFKLLPKGHSFTELEAPLSAGSRVQYLARSHCGAYAATVLGRSGSTIRVRVDNVGDKVVDESEIWRLRQTPLRVVSARP